MAALPAVAEQHVINGIVKDSIENQPIPFASIYVKGTNDGVIGSVNGKFTIETRKRFVDLKIQVLNYKTREIRLDATQENPVIYLQPATHALDEVVVRKHREKYTKKGNPAVAFIEKARAHMHDQNPFLQPYYAYEKYEQMTYGLNDLKNFDRNLIVKKFKGAINYLDTLEVTGKVVLPLSLHEKVSTEYYRLAPKSHKEYITGRQHAGFDEHFDVSSIKRFMDDAFREIDIYRNEINFMQNRFVSPFAKNGPDFYKYYLNDTIDVDGERCIELDFLPFNTESFGFVGRMYFPLNDTSLFIKKIVMNVPRRINLNYVEQVHITQEFKKASNNMRLKTRDDMVIELKVISNTQGLFARRNTFYRDFSFSPPGDSTVFNRKGTQIVVPKADKHNKSYWQKARPSSIYKDENYMHSMMKRLRSSKFFYWSEKALVTLAQGYVATGNPSKLDFGPLNTFVSGNDLEGFRLKLGGMTTVHLIPNWFSRWYVAYGFKDEKVKYHFDLERSFNQKNYHSYEFPVHSLKFTTAYDIDKVGQNYLYTSIDNAVLLLHRHNDDKINYLRQNRLEYKLELHNGFSVAAAVSHNMHEASRLLPFVDGNGQRHAHYHEAGLDVTLRYAPGEKFYQTRIYRFPINIDNPIITLKHTYMPKGLLGNQFEINRTEIGIQKRFWLSTWGYTDIIIKGAKLWSKVAYPDLLWPNVNISYTIQNESFSLMNAMEFATDQNLSWDLTYFMNGALFNHLPLLNRLKLREVFSFKGIYGSLSKKNNPARHPELYQFPARTHCVGLGSKPYMEIGVGLDNVLTFLRVDYVWRLTYRNVASQDKSGLRISLHFAF